MLDVCKWLCRNGAAADVRREDINGFTPLGVTMSYGCNDSKRMTRWLLLNGALSRDKDWNIDKQQCLLKNLERKHLVQDEDVKSKRRMG